MQLTKPLLGIFAILGTQPDWESYFDLSRKGQKRSFIFLAWSLVPLWMVAYGIQIERAARADSSVTLPPTLPFVLIVGVWLFSFPALAYLIGMLFEKMDRVRPWTITRNWTVFALSLLSGAAFALAQRGLPFSVANGVFFSCFMGLLAADIRLAQKVVGFNWGTAILIGCITTAVGLTFVQLAISR